MYEKNPFEQIITSDGFVTSGIVQNLIEQLQQLNNTVQQQVKIIDTMNATMERQEKTIDELKGLQRDLLTHSSDCLIMFFRMKQVNRMPVIFSDS